MYTYNYLQYRPTPLAVLQRRKLNTVSTLSSALSTEPESNLFVRTSSLQSVEGVKVTLEGSSVIEPAFSEDEDDPDEEDVLREIFQKG